MNAVGGFVALETGRSGAGELHVSPALRTGRSCFRVILAVTRPARVHLPFYICDSMLDAARAAGVETRFYELDHRLSPRLDPDELAPDELFVYVNYFGLRDELAHEVVARAGRRVVVDDTQAFFRRPTGEGWAFNSARKFFGVPDGAYLHGPIGDVVDRLARAEEPSIEHLRNRRDGDQDLAYQQYRKYESSLDSEPHPMSRQSARLLADVDYGEVAERRRENFRTLAAMLAPVNGLAPELGDDEVPCYYPFLASRPLRDELIRRRVYVPRLWDEVLTRPGSGYAWERDLAARLCPLPIAQQYDADVMRTVGGRVRQALGA